MDNLEKDFNSIKSLYKVNDGSAEKVKEIYNNLQKRLEDAAKNKASEDEIDEIFEDAQSDLNRVRNRVKNLLPTLTPSQQDQVVVFWTKAAGFLKKTINWIKDKFIELLELIRKGIEVLIEIATSLQTIISMVNSIFTLISLF
jgi:RNA processing factor Prp31